ncbi:MAG: hypothetical protein WC054_02640 [Candidatus Nanopelagicales bacterium]
MSTEHAAAELPDDVAADLEALVQVRARMAELKAIEGPLADRVKEAIADLNAEDATVNGEVVATYRYTAPAKRFDATAFKKQFPEIHAKFVKESAPSRRFVLVGE